MPERWEVQEDEVNGVLLATACSDWVPAVSAMSIEMLHKPGQHGKDWGRMMAADTLGHTARNRICETFLKHPTYKWVFFMDGDMRYPQDALTKLLAHRKTIVSGLYFRRQIEPMLPIAYEWEDDFHWPMRPLTRYPKDQVFKIGAAGFGCLLVHRRVFEDMAPLLRGEPWVAIDAMHWWPHDKEVVKRALEEGNIEVLRKELRPLRKNPVQVGGDLRFSFFARVAGHPVWMDTSVKCGHFTLLGLGEEHWIGSGAYDRTDALFEKISESRLEEEGMVDREALARFQEAKIREAEAKLAGLPDQVTAADNQLSALAQKRKELDEERRKLEQEILMRKGAIETLRYLLKAEGTQPHPNVAEVDNLSGGTSVEVESGNLELEEAADGDTAPDSEGVGGQAVGAGQSRRRSSKRRKSS